LIASIVRRSIIVIALALVASRAARADGDYPDPSLPPEPLEPYSEPIPSPPPAPLNPYPAPDPPPAEPPAEATSAPTTGALRAGIYADSDQTIVFRALAALGGSAGRWSLGGSFALDVISSASVDVRSSPALSMVDVMTSASGRSSTSGGKMSDRRLLGTFGAGYHGEGGRNLNFNVAYANENDYDSVSAVANGSIDLFHRMTTLLGGASVTYNWIGSVLDPTFARTMYALGWAAGIAQVLSPRDALRLRYDGSYASGYQASPYRNVRFGDWTTTVGAHRQIVFANTIGTAAGLPETEPDTRTRHALTLEWLHSFAPSLAIHASATAGTDSWGLTSGAGGLDLRVSTEAWRLELGYRFYGQGAADFYLPRYTNDPSTYRYFTSDKELGQEWGHAPRIDVARVLKQPSHPGDSRALLDVQLLGMYYQYPNFPLLASRWGVFLDVGLTWEP
jgi:hypothetical protein